MRICEQAKVKMKISLRNGRFPSSLVICCLLTQVTLGPQELIIVRQKSKDESCPSMRQEQKYTDCLIVVSI